MTSANNNQRGAVSPAATDPRPWVVICRPGDSDETVSADFPDFLPAWACMAASGASAVIARRNPNGTFCPAFPEAADFPSFSTWFDARSCASALALEHGSAAIVRGGAGFRVLADEDGAAVLALADGAEILAAFPQ